MGGYFGARLQQAGHPVAFIARGRHLQALQRNGLSLKSPLGDAQLKVKAVEKPADAGAVDIVVFAVKLWDTESAAAQLRLAPRPARQETVAVIAHVLRSCGARNDCGRRRFFGSGR